MDNERIPENKMNFTKTVGQLLEGMGNDRFFNVKRDRLHKPKSNKTK